MGFEDLKSVVPASSEARLGRLQVDHLPDVLDVRRLTIQVLQVVGMLPHVHAKERGVAHNNRLLVRKGYDTKLSSDSFLNKPL